ncbi:MAG: uracil-DNA glycosylase [Bacteroidales bacterium]|nr:uracil-DNA glycosylase [Bacteroidales bacterium]
MQVKIHESWQSLLQPEFDSPYFQELTQFVRSEYETTLVFPPAAQIFNAFNECPLDQVKVVILGQDPYHDVGQANGLCFSVNDGIKQPPSLVNIFKEISDDLHKPVPVSGNLERWAKQGVLLLNATLTVRAHMAASHQGHGWETFTDNVIARLAQSRSNIVFMLWGSYAIRKSAMIDPNRHLILTAPHPSPLSSYRGFFGCKHFSKANQYLRSTGQTEIDW